MVMFIKTSTEETVSIAGLRRLFPHTSWPSEPSDSVLAQRGFARLVTAPRPTSYDPFTEALEAQNPAIVDGVWTIKWAVVPLNDVKPRVVPADEFRDRFTTAELVAVMRSAMTDDAVAVYWALASTTGTANLNSATVASGLDLLTAKGLLAAGRKAEILT